MASLSVSVAEEFLCPISHELMSDPVFTCCGNTYERSCIERWFRNHSTDPLTNEELENTNLAPNIALRNTITKWKETHLLLIRRKALTLDQLMSYGSPTFVYRGKYTVPGTTNPVDVAILQKRTGSFDVESKILLRLGHHPRLARFYGRCIEGKHEMLVTEFSPLGSLAHAFERLEGDLTPGGITLLHRVAIIMQICQGMEKVASEGIIHRALAARNVLLSQYDAKNVAATSVKLTNFGQAVNSCGQAHVIVEGNKPSCRYLSPEAIQNNQFSEKSDVWAFGVTIWEVLTGGDVPYADVTDSEILRHVLSGERLPRPAGCRDKLWYIMERCWSTAPADRPSFSELGVMLLEALGSTVTIEEQSWLDSERRSRKSQIRSKLKEEIYTATGNHACRIIVEAMQMAPNDAVVALYAIDSITEFYSGAKVVEREIIEVVLDTMMRFMHDAKVQMYSLKLLAQVGLPNKKNIPEVLAVDVIIAAMKTHMSKTKIQTLGCCVLRILENPNVMNQFARSGGIDLVLHALKSTLNTRLVLFPLHLLEELMRNNTFNRAEILSGGGIDFVVFLLKTHATLSPRIAALGCRVLNAMALNNTEAQKEILAKGGIEAVFEAMTVHPNVEDVQLRGIQAAYSMNTLPSARPRIKEGKHIFEAAAAKFPDGDVFIVSIHILMHGRNIGEIIAVLKTAQGKPGVIFVESAISVLIMLSEESSSNQKDISSEGGIEAVFDAMRKYAGNESVQELAISLLADFDPAFPRFREGKSLLEAATSAFPDNKFMQQEGQAMLRLITRNEIEEALTQCKSINADVVEQGCLTLGNLAEVDGNAEQVSELGGIDVVLTAFENHAVSNTGVAKQGCFALAQLAFNSKHRKQIAAKGGVEAVLTALKTHAASNASVAELACAALCKLAKNHEIRKRIVTKNGIDEVLTALKIHAKSNTGVALYGCFSLGILACDKGEHQMEILSKGGIEASFEAMRNHPHNEGIQEYGTLVFYWMVDLAPALPRVKGGKSVLEAAASAFPNNELIQRNTQEALEKTH